MPASEITTRRPQRVITRENEDAAALQEFRTQLLESAKGRELDRQTRARWEARQPAIARSVRRERKLLAFGIAAVLVIAAGLSLAVAYALLSMGLPLLLAALLAFLFMGGSSCGGCTVIVTVIH